MVFIESHAEINSLYLCNFSGLIAEFLGWPFAKLQWVQLNEPLKIKQQINSVVYCDSVNLEGPAIEVIGSFPNLKGHLKSSLSGPVLFVNFNKS